MKHIYINTYFQGLAFQVEQKITEYNASRFKDIEKAFEPYECRIISWCECHVTGNSTKNYTPSELLT